MISQLNSILLNLINVEARSSLLLRRILVAKLQEAKLEAFKALIKLIIRSISIDVIEVSCFCSLKTR
jgi:hypothetical protein